MAKKITHEFSINRKRWYRGKGSLKSRLLVSLDNKKMCCLGFYEKSLGIPENKLHRIPGPEQLVVTHYPEYTPKSIVKEPDSWLYEPFFYGPEDFEMRESKDCQELMTVNDGEDIAENYREERIKEIFEKNGVKVKFYG